MNWTSIPFKKNPRKTVFLVVFLVAVEVGIYLSFGPYWVIIALILLGGGVVPYWLPTHYSLDEEGVTIKGTTVKRKKKWEEFQSYYEDKNGVFLSPFPRPTRLENYRGIYIRFSENEEEVMGFVSSHIAMESGTQIQT
jgi:hypothetical protein